MSPDQKDPVEGQSTGQPGPMAEGGPGASSEAPPAGPPPNTSPNGEGVEPDREPEDDLPTVKLPPHMNLWVHSCGTVTAGAPPAKCPGCQRLSPEGEWLLYKVALV